jgi:phenylacetate-CoA ligase
MRREIEEAWNMIATDVYGLSEIIGPGVAQECTYKDGLHIFSDVFYPEIINPKTGQPVAEGEDGELTITTLTKQGIPLIRYGTRDVVSMRTDTCRCGRTSPRISKIKGRTDDMIVVRGINVFPSQIESALLEAEGTLPHYQIILTRVKGLDEVEVQVEVTREVFSDRIGALEGLQARLEKSIENVLGLRVTVRLVEPNTLKRSEGKAKRVFDQREM